MWQRKQTIFLSITALCMAVMIFFPIWVSEGENEVRTLFPLHYTVKSGDTRTTIYYPYAICAIFAAAAVTLAVMEITKFENRILQVKLGAFNSLFMAGALGSAVYFATNLMKSQGVAGAYGFALYMPAAAMISNMIANRFIRRDEKLVRDSDRMR